MILFSNPAKDAKSIQAAIDYRVLKAAWDFFANIEVGSARNTHKVTTPAWFALFAIQNYNGDFTKFDKDELHFLKALTNIRGIYDEIIASIEANSKNENLGRHILNTNPILIEIVPSEFYNSVKINEYIISVIKNYERLLEEFYKKYKSKIDKAIRKLEEDVNKETIESAKADN